jgi:formate dehydrogenase major subunit
MTKIQFELDGKQVEAIDGETIWQVAKRQGREIPHLCYSPEPDYRPDGNCRACMVEVEGERVLAASCKRTPSVGMKVKSASPRAIAAQKMVMELSGRQISRRAQPHTIPIEILALGQKVEVTESRFPAPSAGRAMPAILRCASISIPASSAACACAPAARSRSTT